MPKAWDISPRRARRLRAAAVALSWAPGRVKVSASYQTKTARGAWALWLTTEERGWSLWIRRIHLAGSEGMLPPASTNMVRRENQRLAVRVGTSVLSR